MEDESIVHTLLGCAVGTLAMFAIAPGIALYAKGRWRQNLTVEARRRIVWSYAGCVASVVLGGVWIVRSLQTIDGSFLNPYYLAAWIYSPMAFGCLSAHYSLLAMQGGSLVLQNMAKAAKGTFWFNCAVVLHWICRGVAWEFTE